MSDDDRPKSFEETLRSIAAEVTKSAEKLSRAEFGDLERLARLNGLDTELARGFADEAGRWFREQLAGSDLFPDAATADPSRSDSSASTTSPSMADVTPEDITDAPIADGVPSPLDLPTAAQGQALAALDSGRWTVEPGSVKLATQTGQGPQPRGAHGLGLALHVRDWVDQDGQLTSAGGHALERWLESSTDGE